MTVTRPSSRRALTTTWWGRAWVEALEQRARLDPNRLPRGRTYARGGRVGPLRIEPGSIHAAVRGSRATPYSVHVRVRMLTDDEWDRLLDAVAARAAHTAALLDGELPPEVVADAAAAGVDLLPGAGEVGPRCSCPDWADPCKHAAAVVYLVAQVLDADPFALLRLRGRSREEVLAGLRRRRAGPSVRAHAAAVGTGKVDPGVPARDAYRRAADRPAPPAVPLPPRQPGLPAPLAVDPPAESGLRRGDLADLAADAARRAWELCAGEGDGGLRLDPGLDLVRRAAWRWGEPDAPDLTELAGRAGVPARQLARRAAAWQLGGADAVSVGDEAWGADAEAIDEARAAVVAAELGPVRARDNRVTFDEGRSQLRLSRRGSWYRFERVGRQWDLSRGPQADPAVLLDDQAASSADPAVSPSSEPFEIA